VAKENTAKTTFILSSFLRALESLWRKKIYAIRGRKNIHDQNQL
jgi:hypothetical protein